MKRQALYILLALLGFTTLRAQVNLVPNGSFEEYNICPVGPDELYNVNQWFDPTYASPDYFNACSPLSFVSVPINYMGHQEGSGEAYSGIGIHITAQPNYLREYISVKLIQPLEANKKYCVSYFISLAEHSKLYLSSIGVLFTDTIIPTPLGGPLPFSPQLLNSASNQLSDSIGWKLIEFEYTATGDENYLTIGCFENTANLSYTYFNNMDTINAFAYYYIDDVSVAACENSINIPNVFTPNKDGINETFQIQALPENSFLSIYNRWGNIVFKSSNYLNNWDGGDLADGIYYYILKPTIGSQKKGTVTILRN